MFDDPALEVYEEYLIQKHLYPKKSKFSFINFQKLIVGIVFLICIIIGYIFSDNTHFLMFINGVFFILSYQYLKYN